jgi:hypothetical protein
MSKRLIQIGDEIREMTDEEYAQYEAITTNTEPSDDAD